MHIWRFGVAANSLSGDLKHMSHLQKTLMPFVLVCLLVHLCGVSDALLRSSCAMTDCDLFLIGFSFGSLVCTVFSFGFFFFFNPMTAYEISQCDWSSDVCSFDLVKDRIYL